MCCHGLVVLGCEFWVMGCRLRFAGGGFWVLGFGFCGANLLLFYLLCGWWLVVVGCGLRVLGFGLWVMGFGFRVLGWLFWLGYVLVLGDVFHGEVELKSL